METGSSVLASLRDSLSAWKPICVTKPDGNLRIAESSARFLCDVDSAAASGDESAIHQLHERFQAASPTPNPAVELLINVVYESLALNGLNRALVSLVDMLDKEARPQINLHFSAPVDDWSSLFLQIEYLRNTFSRPVTIQLNGPFSVATDAEVEAMWNWGIRPVFAAAWLPNGASAELNRCALARFSEAGLQTVIHYYVHADNLAEIESKLQSDLRANYWSGFALPLVATSPYYRFDQGFPALPDPTDYCRLLTSCYKDFPFYDAGFAPLDELAWLVRFGGWHKDLDIPATVNLIVDAKGDIGVYRQFPALAQHWINAGDLVLCSKEQVQDSFLEFVRSAWRWEKNRFCRNCEWRRLCGGLDGFQEGGNLAYQNTVCAHRLLFLQHFLLSRGADFSYPSESPVDH